MLGSSERRHCGNSATARADRANHRNLASAAHTRTSILPCCECWSTAAPLKSTAGCILPSPRRSGGSTRCPVSPALGIERGILRVLACVAHQLNARFVAQIAELAELRRKKAAPDRASRTGHLAPQPLSSGFRRPRLRVEGLRGPQRCNCGSEHQRPSESGQHDDLRRFRLDNLVTTPALTVAPPIAWGELPATSGFC
jgi:hypothetical protein